MSKLSLRNDSDEDNNVSTDNISYEPYVPAKSLPFTPDPEEDGCAFILASGLSQGMRCNMPVAAGSSFCRYCLKHPKLKQVMKHRESKETQYHFYDNSINTNICPNKFSSKNIPKIKFS